MSLLSPFDPFNAFLVNKSINKKKIHLNNGVYYNECYLQLCFILTVIAYDFREKKKTGGKVDAKKKSGGEKEKKKEGGNESFKSKEFISSEESSSESDHGRGSKRKVCG